MKLKSLLANKNVVTILGAILLIVALYAMYSWRVKEAINPIRIPYAKVTIGPRTRIERDMIDYVDIQEASIKGKVLTNPNTQIIGWYTNINTTIPKGSLFYAGEDNSLIVRFEDLADSWIANIPKGMVAYNLRVDVMSTYGNSIYPGNYVDIYFKGVDNGKIVIGKILSNVKVSVVKDDAGNNVFENITEHRTPSQVIIAVTEEMNSLLRTAEYMNNSKLIIVPTNKSYTENSEEVTTEISSEEIKAFIESSRV